METENKYRDGGISFNSDQHGLYHLTPDQRLLEDNLDSGGAFLPCVMSCDRFELLFWFMHASHLEGNVVRRVDKVKVLLECLVSKFQAHFYPGQELAVDDTRGVDQGWIWCQAIYICYRSL